MGVLPDAPGFRRVSPISRGVPLRTGRLRVRVLHAAPIFVRCQRPFLRRASVRGQRATDKPRNVNRTSGPGLFAKQIDPHRGDCGASPRHSANLEHGVSREEFGVLWLDAAFDCLLCRRKPKASQRRKSKARSSSRTPYRSAPGSRLRRAVFIRDKKISESKPQQTGPRLLTGQGEVATTSGSTHSNAECGMQNAEFTDGTRIRSEFYSALRMNEFAGAG